MRYQIIWLMTVALQLVAVMSTGGCQPSLGVPCGDGWCGVGQICDDPQAQHPKCIRNTCGNGSVDKEEECDDGNATGGDGCSANCMTERCGNGIRESGEQCEDGNAIDGDGCSTKCATEQCGNSTVDRARGEQCDDGNLVDGDGCNVDCTLPSCGSGVVDMYEQCDDGNTLDADGCSASCTEEVCGNGILDRLSGEQCDDGNNTDEDGCSAECLLPSCGDGDRDLYEQCDDRNTIDGDGCSLSCTVEHCSNRILDAREQCDDGNVVDADGCEHDCALPFCGNSIVGRYEQCDDGNADNGDGCSKNCTIESCGNGIVDSTIGEQCDPPSGPRGCSMDCKFEQCGNSIKDRGEECDGIDFGPGGNPSALMCTSDCHVQQCGNGRLDQAEQCDDGNQNSGDGCSGGTLAQGGCKFEICGDGITNDQTATLPEDCDEGSDGVPRATATCDADCTAPRCGDLVVNPLFAPDGALGPEQCDPPSVGRGCSALCQFERCGNGVVDRAAGEVCDPPEAGVCGVDCKSLLQCGNALLDPGEECDLGQGGNSATGECRLDCVFNRCGDGFTNSQGLPGQPGHIEACDDATPAAENSRLLAPTQSARCNIDCSAAQCGDGKVNPLNVTFPARATGEECDDRNNVNGDGCDNNCTITACGNNVVNTDRGETCDDGNLIDNDGCDSTCLSAACGNGALNPGEVCDDGNRNSGDGCDNNCTVTGCGNGVTTAGEECDGEPNCSSTCRIMGCGNSIVDLGEECDDGNPVDEDDCRSDCVLNRCGDGHQNMVLGREACDPALPRSNGDRSATPMETLDCNLDCTSAVCNDGKINRARGEQCDNGLGNNLPDNDCTDQCLDNICGDNRVDRQGPRTEQCDDSADPACSAACQFASCGNGLVEPSEECDDGNLVENDDCRTDCVINRCGDGYANDTPGPTMQICDTAPLRSEGDRAVAPTDSSGCDSDCTLPLCGDGHVNRRFSPAGAPVPEQCDDTASSDCNSNCTLPSCGNGVTDAGEECDLGSNNSNTGDCTLACRNARCGDGFLRVGATIVEVCDDGNADDCGSCNSTCMTVTSAASASVIFAIAGADLRSGVDNLTIGNSVLLPRTFTFQLTSTPGDFEIGYAASDTAGTVAAKIAIAIGLGNEIEDFQMTAYNVGSIVFLVNDRASWLSGWVSEQVGNSAFTALQINDGAGGDCSINDGCMINDDCHPELICRGNQCVLP